MNQLIRECIDAGHALGWYVLDPIDDVGDLGAGLEGVLKESVRERLKGCVEKLMNNQWLVRNYGTETRG